MNTLTCKEVLARLYEYLDGELPAEDLAAVREHLERCQECYPQLRFCQSFQEALRRAAHGQPGAPPALRARIADLLRAEGIQPT